MTADQQVGNSNELQDRNCGAPVFAGEQQGEQQIRRYTFKLYPNKAQDAELHRQRKMHAALWNALLQQREEAYRRRGKGLSQFDQSKELTALRAELPEWDALSRAAMEATAKTLDLAFQAFFSRVKKGQTGGYPRFRSLERSESLPLGAHGRGWKFREGNRLYVMGVPGMVKMRGKFPAQPTAIKTGGILWRGADWWLSVAVEMPCRRIAGTQHILINFDLIDQFAEVKAEAKGECLACPEGRISLKISGVETGSESDSGELRDSSCGEPAFAGERQAAPQSASGAASCGAPAFEGEQQGIAERIAARRACDDPGFAGKRQEERPTGSRFHNVFGKPGFAGEQQEEPICQNSCGKPGFAGNRQEKTKVVLPLASCGTPDFGKTTENDRADRIKSDGDTRFRAPTKDAAGNHKRGSIRWYRSRQRAARLTTFQARRRADALHNWSTEIVRNAASIQVTAPPVKESTESNKGDTRRWGAAVQTGAMLNRHVLDQAPAAALAMLAYKAREAGVEYQQIETKPITIHHETATATKAVRRARRKTK